MLGIIFLEKLLCYGKIILPLNLASHDYRKEVTPIKSTLSVIKADIGNVGGQLEPSERLIDRVRESLNDNQGGIVNDLYIGHIGDDIAILFSHQQGVGSDEIHK